MTGDGPPRRRRMDRDERRRHLLEVAVAVFAAEDADAVNIDQIADRAGVSRALVYEYFGDRANLIDEVRRRCAREFQILLDEVIERAESAQDLLVRFVGAHIEFAARGAGAYRLATENQRRGTKWLTEYFGGGPEARVMAAAAAESLRAFVLTWAEHDDTLSSERATELITAFLDGGLVAIRPLGVRAPSARRRPDGQAVAGA